MRIGIFTDDYLPTIDGQVSSIRSFAKEFIALGHQVYIFTPEYPGFVDTEPNIIRLKSFPAPFPPGYRLAIPLSSSVFKKVKELKIDIIHIQSPFFVAWLGVHIARKLGLPIVSTYHTLYPVYATCYIPVFPNFIYQFAILLSKWSYNSYDLVITPSSQMKKALLSYGVTKPIEVLPTGINTDLFGSGDGMKFRKKYNIDADDKVLLFMGRLAKEKNVNLLLHAFAEVVKKFKAKLVLCGEGISKQEIIALTKTLDIQDKVIFPGFVRKEEWSNAYAATDLFVLSSLTETQGLVLLEAMSAGVPIVAVGAMGVLDVMEGEQGGLLSGNNSKEFAEKVIRLLSDKELYKLKKTEGLNRAREFSARKMAEKLLNIYYRMLK